MQAGGAKLVLLQTGDVKLFFMRALGGKLILMQTV